MSVKSLQGWAPRTRRTCAHTARIGSSLSASPRSYGCVLGSLLSCPCSRAFWGTLPEKHPPAPWELPGTSRTQLTNTSCQEGSCASVRGCSQKTTTSVGSLLSHHTITAPLFLVRKLVFILSLSHLCRVQFCSCSCSGGKRSGNVLPRARGCALVSSCTGSCTCMVSTFPDATCVACGEAAGLMMRRLT